MDTKSTEQYVAEIAARDAKGFNWTSDIRFLLGVIDAQKAVLQEAQVVVEQLDRAAFRTCNPFRKEVAWLLGRINGLLVGKAAEVCRTPKPAAPQTSSGPNAAGGPAAGYSGPTI